jgi:hypothetical protein
MLDRSSGRYLRETTMTNALDDENWQSDVRVELSRNDIADLATGIGNDFREIRTDLAAMRSDISAMRQDFAGIHEDLTEICRLLQRRSRWWPF